MDPTSLHAAGMQLVHATCVAVDGAGVLLRGPSGSGKSDLALRLIDAGCRLVADDYTVLAVEDGRLIATAPDELQSLLEIRGIGIIRMPALPHAPLAAVIDLIPSEQAERMPRADEERLLGIAVPRFRLSAMEGSAAAKVRLVAGLAAGLIMRHE